MIKCPECGSSYERVASHWAKSSCGYPNLKKTQKSVISGILLGRGQFESVSGSQSTRRISKSMSYGETAHWINNKLSWMGGGVTTFREERNSSTEFRVRSPAHPLQTYNSWNKTKGRSGMTPPEEYSLTPLTARVWWAIDGHLEHRSHKDTIVGVFTGSRSNPGGQQRINSIKNIIEKSGFGVENFEDRIIIPNPELRDWVDWIGDPVPGAEKKWQI